MPSALVRRTARLGAGLADGTVLTGERVVGVRRG